MMELGIMKYKLALYALTFPFVFTAVFLTLWLLFPSGLKIRDTIDAPPTVCSTNGCLYATATPFPTWGAATVSAYATAVATYQVGWVTATAVVAQQQETNE